MTFKDYFLKPLLFSLGLFCIHYIMVAFTATGLSLHQLIHIHLFLSSLTLLLMYAFALVFKVAANYVGFTFLASIILKMFAFVIYLFFYLKSVPDEVRRAVVLSFLVVYIFHLAFETIQVYKSLNALNQKSSDKSQ